MVMLVQSSRMEEHYNEINDDVHDNDDNDDDWIIQQAEVWAATEKETNLNVTDNNNTIQERSDKATKSITESPVRVRTVKTKTNKKRKLEIVQEPSLWETSTSSETTYGSNVQLLSNPHQQGPQLYSLHLTQLSYDATDFDIREHFIRHGCMNITSIRLVYDHGNNKKSDGFKKKFRGVAFVDIYMDTPESYETLLHQIHGSTMLQRKINVRPVKSKVELASIVQQTKLYVHQQIQIGKEKKKKIASDAQSGDDKTEKNTLNNSKRPKTKSKKSATESLSSKSVNDNVDSLHVKKRNATSSTVSSNSPKENQKSITAVKKLKSNTTSSPSPKKCDVNATKLTKQQRNRKAAILMQHRRQSK